MYRLFEVSLFASIAIVTFGHVESLCAAEKNPNEAERAAIRAAATEYLKAKKQGNLDGMHNSCTADADYVDASGRTFKMHALIDNPRAAPAREAAPAEAAHRSSVRLITPEVAIEDGAIESDAPGNDGQAAGRFTAVWVKRDGRWLLDSLRESASLTATSNPRLQPLAWLLGEWAGKADDSAMLISARWSDGGNFIVRDFVIRGENGSPITGTQRIGWDPVAHKLKSWSFDSQGGTGEAYWRREGSSWIMDSIDVTADGRKAKTSATYVPDGPNRFVWEVRSANVDADTLPPRRVEFKRAPEHR